jgi:UDP-N-acetylmuramyl tripeptide synthase
MMAALAARGRTLGELLGAEAGGYGRLPITDLTLDSRQVTSGAAFVAVAGGRAHGLAYAAEALARGAAPSRICWRRRSGNRSGRAPTSARSVTACRRSSRLMGTRRRTP